MRKFKNLKTNCIEIVTNEELFEQYENYPNVYKEIFDKKEKNELKEQEPEKSNKKEKNELKEQK